jgi:hypothetical protein
MSLEQNSNSGKMIPYMNAGSQGCTVCPRKNGAPSATQSCYLAPLYPGFLNMCNISLSQSKFLAQQFSATENIFTKTQIQDIFCGCGHCSDICLLKQTTLVLATFFYHA